MQSRNYGIDLLRLVLMYMVCVLHVLGQGGILRLSAEGTFKYNLFWFMETAAYCAVNAFALISGYTASDRPQKYEKYLVMWFQVLFYSLIFSLVLKLCGVPFELTVKKCIKMAMPVSSGSYWYFKAYTIVFFAMPLLNPGLSRLGEMEAKKTLILIFLFSCISFYTDSFVTNGGYTAIWLLVLYCTGNLARRAKLFEKYSNTVLILLWAVCLFVSWIIKVTMGIGRFINYVSPTILASGLIMVILFSRLHLSGKVVSKFAPLAFGIYLFQNNEIIWSLLKDAFMFVTEMSAVVGALCVLGLAMIIYIAGLAVEWFRSLLEKLLRIQKLSQMIVRLIAQISEKVCKIVM